jgi:hypothetical protein
MVEWQENQKRFGAICRTSACPHVLRGNAGRQDASVANGVQSNTGVTLAKYRTGSRQLFALPSATIALRFAS